MIRKLLIANRSEIACRIMRTCHEMGIATVAVYSDADMTALHVEMADEALHIGGAAASASYLNIDNILQAAQRTGSDAIHAGYGFLAENATFAQAVINAELIWVGATPQAIEAMGNKATAKKLLQDIPYVPGYVGDDQSDATFTAEAAKIGYPIMVKAAAGGGGKGMRLVHQPEKLASELAAARREAKQGFGDDTLMLEKALIRPRHIEVQIVGDKHGNVIALGERECSIQRRHQKIIEETPAYGLSDELRRALHETAINIAQQLNYDNVGTVEFLLDSDNNFYFMEMNTRLQVEHPVTEMVYGVDLVRWQLDIAQGTPLTALAPDGLMPDGHAIEVRIYAEDPYHDFLPVTGKILHWQEPHHVRVDSGIRSGDVLSTHYDPLLAKIIAHSRNRETAIRKLDYALSKLQFLGLRNNVGFLRHVLMHADHLSGDISTQFLDDHPELMESDANISHVAIIAAAIARQGRGYWRNNPNRPIKHNFDTGKGAVEILLTPQRNGETIVHLGDDEYRVRVHNETDGQFDLEVNGHRQTVAVAQGENDIWWVYSAYGTTRLQWLTPLPLPSQQLEVHGSLRAPMPGQVIAVHVAVGQTVKQGDVLLIIEAMKMEHRIEAPYDGTVETIRYSTGDTVQQDEILLALADAND
ncbi:MAG: biotin carboxylase N-terminal domain-containing protein [Anaerolineae bacterium]|nr:biotin carboxylase N-terminal domain-containing protein [Anaerolineae bacterium]